METREEMTRQRQDEWRLEPAKKNKKRRFIVIGSIILVLIVVTGTLYTPRITGIVVDATTGRPVKDAWVRATADISTNTIAGGSSGVASLARPHTRTDSEGRFTIPFRFYIKPPPPLGFGSSVDRLYLEAHTIDGRGAELRFEKGFWMPWWRLNVRIAPLNWSPSREAHYLEDLSAYCLFGRFNVERPTDKGCDIWEMDYAIKRHERFLEELGVPKTGQQQVHFSSVLDHLARLYEQRGRYREALDAFTRIRDFDLARQIRLGIEEYERKINELKAKMGQ